MEEALKQIKSDIMYCCGHAKATIGFAFPDKYFLSNYALRYNPKKKRFVKDAFNELISEGLLEDKDGRVVLAEKGFDYIYPEKQADVVRGVKNDIIKCLGQAGSDIGHAFPDKIFTSKYVTQYNPKQKQAIEDAAQELFKEGILEVSDGHMVLTKKGADAIY